VPSLFHVRPIVDEDGGADLSEVMEPKRLRDEVALFEVPCLNNLASIEDALSGRGQRRKGRRPAPIPHAFAEIYGRSPLLRRMVKEPSMSL